MIPEGAERMLRGRRAWRARMSGNGCGRPALEDPAIARHCSGAELAHRRKRREPCRRKGVVARQVGGDGSEAFEASWIRSRAARRPGGASHGLRGPALSGSR